MCVKQYIKVMVIAQTFKYFNCHNSCMETPRLAILYDRSAVSRTELDAAMAGIGRFGRFGVQCEGIEVSDKKAVATIKRGERIKEIIGRDPAVLNVMDFRAMGFLEAFDWLVKDLRKIGVRGYYEAPARERGMGIGLMRGELLNLSDADGGRNIPSIGLSYRGIGGVVTLRGIRRGCDPELAARAIEAAVAHETGHVLGIGGHCPDESCLMRANDHLEDFVEVTVRQARDLCRRCESLVRWCVSDLSRGIEP